MVRLWTPQMAACGEDMRSPAVEDWSLGLPSIWAWQSISPGTTVYFERSITVAPEGTESAIREMRSFSMTITAFWRTWPVRTFMRRPARIAVTFAGAGGCCAPARLIAGVAAKAASSAHRKSDFTGTLQKAQNPRNESTDLAQEAQLPMGKRALATGRGAWRGRRNEGRSIRGRKRGARRANPAWRRPRRASFQTSESARPSTGATGPRKFLNRSERSRRERHAC